MKELKIIQIVFLLCQAKTFLLKGVHQFELWHIQSAWGSKEFLDVAHSFIQLKENIKDHLNHHINFPTFNPK